jgi:hypothetical protein
LFFDRKQAFAFALFLPAFPIVASEQTRIPKSHKTINLVIATDLQLPSFPPLPVIPAKAGKYTDLCGIVRVANNGGFKLNNKQTRLPSAFVTLQTLTVFLQFVQTHSRLFLPKIICVQTAGTNNNHQKSAQNSSKLHIYTKQLESANTAKNQELNNANCGRKSGAGKDDRDGRRERACADNYPIACGAGEKSRRNWSKNAGVAGCLSEFGIAGKGDYRQKVWGMDSRLFRLRDFLRVCASCGSGRFARNDRRGRWKKNGRNDGSAREECANRKQRGYGGKESENNKLNDKRERKTAKTRGSSKFVLEQRSLWANADQVCSANLNDKGRKCA